MAYRGKYRVKNPLKYKGDFQKVTYRSGLELKVMNYLDNHRDVLEWSSEEVIIPYRSPIDNKVHRYFTDFYVKRRTTTGEVVVNIIEVKPLSQCQEPVRKTKTTRRFLNEVKTWGVNSAKWSAARSFCQQRGWEFIVLTEKQIENL